MFIERQIYPSLKSHLTKKQITVITGMRRTGKTTLAKQLLSEVKSSNKAYFDLERFDIRELFAEKNFDNIVKSLTDRGLDFSKKVNLVIDEIQLVPEIASVLKYLYDNYQIKFITTGSSSYYLKHLFSESLAGRKKIFEIYPLSFSEYLTFNNISFNKTDFVEQKFSSSEFERLKNYYEDYIKFGGFPEVVLATNRSDKTDLISDILSSYINIDIKTLADFRSDKNISNLLKMLASRVGSRLDYAKLSRLTGMSRPTIQSYIDFFEKTYLIKRISVLSKQPDREIVKAQKLYFCDNGFLNLLAEVSSGAQFENAIFNQIHQLGKINYYALKTGKEVDFILNENLALEIKESPIDFDLTNLIDLTKSIRISKSRLVGRNPVPNFTDYIWGGEVH